MSRLIRKASWQSWLALGIGLAAALGIVLRAGVMAQGTLPNNLPTVQFSTSSYTVGEADGSITLTVTLSAPSMEAITVDYATSDGTATGDSNGGADGGDYAVTSGALTFSPGQTSKTIVIDIYGDGCCESNETFTVTLTNPTGATLGAPSGSTVTIVDDDSGCP
jgi:chitinase